MIQTALSVATPQRANGPERRSPRPDGDDFEAAFHAAVGHDRSGAVSRPMMRHATAEGTEGRVAEADAPADGAVADGTVAMSSEAADAGDDEDEGSSDETAPMTHAAGPDAAAGAGTEAAATATVAAPVAEPIDPETVPVAPVAPVAPVGMTDGVADGVERSAVTALDGNAGTTNEGDGSSPTASSRWTVRGSGLEGPPVHRTGDTEAHVAADPDGAAPATIAEDAAPVDLPGMDGTPGPTDADPDATDPAAEAPDGVSTDADQDAGTPADGGGTTTGTTTGPETDLEAGSASATPTSDAPGHDGGAANDAVHRADGAPARPGAGKPTAEPAPVVGPVTDPPAGDAAAPGPVATAVDASPDVTPAGGATPTVPTAAPTNAPTATPAAAPHAPAPPVAEQLVGQVRPLLERPDGTHELHIELHPAELGQVRLQVTLDDGVISVRVHAEDPASRRLLAQSMGDLRAALEGSGVRTGDLDVDGGTGGRRDHGRDGAHEPARRDAVPTEHPRGGRRPLTSASSALDVLL